MTVIRGTVHVFCIISIVVMVFCGVLGIIEEMTGSSVITEKVLSKLHIPLSYNQFVLFTVINIVVFWVTYIVKNKIS